MRIGEVAAEAAVNVQTLRYYERVGLLPKPGRLTSGYRAYDRQTVRRVRFIKRAQELGCSLIHFLRSLDAGAQWQTSTPMDSVLTMPEAWDVAQSFVDRRLLADAGRAFYLTS